MEWHPSSTAPWTPCAVPAYPDLTATHSSACPPPAHAPTSLARRCPTSTCPARPRTTSGLFFLCSFPVRTASLLLAVCRAGLAALSTRSHVLLLTVHVCIPTGAGTPSSCLVASSVVYSAHGPPSLSHPATGTMYFALVSHVPSCRRQPWPYRGECGEP